MTATLTFTAKVQPMYGNLDIESMDTDQLRALIENTYDIPEDCIVDGSVEVR